MAFLNRQIADALCTVITLGFAKKMADDGNPLVFEYEDPENIERQAKEAKQKPEDVEKAKKEAKKDVDDHELIRDAFRNFGVKIDVCGSIGQEYMPYILGHKLSQERRDKFTVGLIEYSNKIRSMFEEANRQNPPPRGAYIGVQFFVNSEGKILKGETDDPRVYGPSALSLHEPVYRDVTGDERDAIGIAYYKARMSTNNAALAVTAALATADPRQRFETDYETGKIFGSSHGMIRAMVNSVTPPKDSQSVFAEIALGAGTTKVASCIPCAIFMQSFGYPASSIHLGRGDNWRIPDSPSDEILTNWKNTIIRYYLSGLEVFNPTVALEGNNITLDNAAAVIVVSNTDADDIMPEIPNLFLEALTFEGSFMDRIRNTLFH
jgi:hypothetical protein